MPDLSLAPALPAVDSRPLDASRDGAGPASSADPGSRSTPVEQLAAFREDVLAGLRHRPRSLPSRWLYDDAGSELFEQITRLPEYAATRTETAILAASGPAIAAFIGPDATLIEYGAGAAVKTERLLEALERPRAYLPVDISGDFLALSAERLSARFPGLPVVPVVADFTADLGTRLDAALDEALGPTVRDGGDEGDEGNGSGGAVGPGGSGSRVGFFPGSTIGNLATADALALLRRIGDQVGPEGKAVIGFDLIKDRDTLLRAYDDSRGVTAAFDRNLLVRINRELDADLPIGAFRHESRWNRSERAIEMHLVCERPVTAVIAGETFRFDRGESIHTETSRKYDPAELGAFVAEAGWRLDRLWTDEGIGFAVAGLSRVDGGVDGGGVDDGADGGAPGSTGSADPARLPGKGHEAGQRP